MIGKKTSQEMIDRIRDLRIKGLSLKAICKGLKMSKSTVSLYIKGLRKNNKCIGGANGTAQIMKTKWNKKRQEVINLAIKEFPEIRKDPDMMLFLGLYWGEGCKSENHSIGVTNNDPDVIKLCHKMFRKLSPNNKIAVTIHCYPSHNKNICKKFWKELLNENVEIKDAVDQRSIPLEFIHPRCLYGRCVVRYGHFEVYWRIITWIKMLSQDTT